MTIPAPVSPVVSLRRRVKAQMTEFPAACVPSISRVALSWAPTRVQLRERERLAPVARHASRLRTKRNLWLLAQPPSYRYPAGKRCEKERGNGYGSGCEGLRERRRCGWDGDVPHPCGDLRRERGVRDRARSAYDARAERARLGRVDRARLGRRRCERGDGGARCDGPPARSWSHGARSSSFSGPTSWRRDISSSDCFKRPSPSKCAGDGWGIRSFQAGRRGERAARCGIPRSGNAPDRHFALE